MKEVKPSKKPLGDLLRHRAGWSCCCSTLLLLPWLTERQVEEVDYGTFMTMTAGKQHRPVWISSPTRSFLPIKRKSRSTRPA